MWEKFYLSKERCDVTVQKSDCALTISFITLYPNSHISKRIRRVYSAFWLSLTGITVIPRNFCIMINSFNFSLSNGCWCLKLPYVLLGTCSCVFGSLYITMSTLEQASRAFKAGSHEPSPEQLQQRSEGELWICKVKSVLSCYSAELLINCSPWLNISICDLLICSSMWFTDLWFTDLRNGLKWFELLYFLLWKGCNLLN